MPGTLLRKVLLVVILVVMPVTAINAACQPGGTWLQVLGSGGPELDDGRASSGYLVWQNGHARVLVDLGAGSLLNFDRSDARLNDIDVILLTHLHVDHSSDLPALVKASYFSDRRRDLPILGPTGNHLMPSMRQFATAMFGDKGAYRYLGSYLDGSDSYRLSPRDVDAQDRKVRTVYSQDGLKVDAVAVNHGPIPALAWHVTLAGKSIVFSGDMSNRNNTLAGMAKGADMLVAHHAIPEDAGQVARNLHMPPSVIGKIAAEAGVKSLVLSHRMNRTLGREQESLEYIHRAYQGRTQFADDMQCIRVE